MKTYILAFVFIAVSAILYAQPPQVPATPGATFGKAITADGAFKLSELPARLENVDSLDVKVTGKVIAVCPKMGCWMKLEMPDKSTVFVDMKDYAFFVPTAMTGKTVAIAGIARNEITSVEDLKHFAHDANKSQKEIDAITEPKKEIVLTASGILVVR